MLFERDPALLKTAPDCSREASTPLDLSVVDPLLRNVVEITNRSEWLQTELSCSGPPEDHASDSDGTPRRWGSYTRGRMYIAYSCARRDVKRVVRVAIAKAHRKLALSIHLGLPGVESAADSPGVVQLAVTVFYEPRVSSEVQAALSVFEGIAKLAGTANRRLAKRLARATSAKGHWSRVNESV